MQAQTFSLGMACRKIVTFKKAVNVTRESAKDNHKYAKKILQGNACLNLKMYKKAIRCYKKALKIKSDDEKVFYNLGIAYRNSGMFREAVNSFKYAVHLKPDDAMAYYYLGLSCGKLDKYKQAREFLKQSITIDPENIKAHYSLGVINVALKDNGAAMEEYKILSRLSPRQAGKLSEMLLK